MFSRLKKSKLGTIILTALCFGLGVIVFVLLAKIVALAGSPPANTNMQGVRIITPTPQPNTATPTASLTPTPTQAPTATATNTPTATATATTTATATATATSTATPSPTITPFPLSHNRPTAIAVEIVPDEEGSGAYPIPTAVPRYPISEDAMTIVLLGSDRRPDWEHWNTDAIQFVVVYPKIPSVTLLSIPRDLYVYLPGFHMSRVNVADMYGNTYGFDGGGFGLLNQTLLYNLGITADYYVKVNFQGLKDIVDTLGGIDVPVHCHLEDYWPYPDENGEFQRIALEPGIHHMDGKLALWYSRTRKTTSVFNREERQQQVLEAIWMKAQADRLLEMLPTLYEQYGDLVETDLGWGNILSLGLIASQIEPSQVTMYNIGRQEVTPYVTVQGGNVFLPEWGALATVVDRALLPPAASRAALASAKVEVWNGTGHADWDLLAADRLYQSGLTPILGTGNGEAYSQTHIQVFGEHAKGTGLPAVQTIFGIPDSQVSYVDGGNGDIRLRLILGSDYQVCR